MSEEEKKTKIPKLDVQHRFSWLWALSDPAAKPFLRKKDDEETGGPYLDFGVDYPIGNCYLPSNKAWVRDCYHELNQKVWEIFSSKERRLAISGTPGTGKTIFGLLVLIDLIRAIRGALAKKEALPFGLDGTIFYEVGTHKTTTTYKIKVDEQTVELCKHPQMEAHVTSFWIKDGDCSVVDVPCSLLVTSSPKENGKEVLKSFRFIYFMRMWQTSEMIECFTAIGGPSDQRVTYDDPVLSVYDDVQENLEVGEIFQVKLWRRLIKELGHVPRRVFKPETNFQIRNAALTNLKQENLTNLLSLVNSGETAAVAYTPDFPHALLSMAVSSSMRSYAFVPATKFIAKLITKKALQDELQVARSLMGRQTGSCLGKAFEPYAIFLLRIPTTHTIRNLETDATEELVLEDLHTENQVENKDIPTLALSPGCIYTPADPNFPCIDAWTSKDMFQVKSSGARVAKTGAPRFLHVRSKVTNKRIIYVVPKPHAANFKYVEQTVADAVEEWVMELPM